MRATAVVALFLTSALAFADSKLPPAATKKIDYEKDVQPILAQKCHSCHGDEVQQSGLRLDKRQQALRGGDYGPVIIAGDSAKSKLIHRVANGDGGLQMPPTGPLSNEEIGVLRAWIDQGVDFRIQVQDDPPAKPLDPNLASAIAAVRSGDTKQTARLLAAHPGLVSAKDAAGATLLHHAAGFGNLATLNLLLEKGAAANTGNKRKSTPLLWAIPDEAKVQALLQHGADVNVKNVDGRTPLYHAASMANAVPVIRLLLAKGADPNAKTMTGMTPLMAAARTSTAALQLLIEKGADVNARNAAGASALSPAAQTGNPEAVRMLLAKGADPNFRTKRNETALAEAATSGNEEAVKLLLDKGAEVDVADIRGYTPLLYAAASDAVPAGIVKMLLAKGASQEPRGDDETARMLAVKRGDTEVARLLGASEAERKAMGVVPPPAPNATERNLAEAVKPALVLLEKQSHNFIRIGGCNSCHGQDLPSAATAIARERGIPAPRIVDQLPLSMHTLNPSRIMDLAAPSVASIGWEMFDLGNNRAPRDEYTDATIRFIKSMQTPEGHWRAFQSRRPPMNTGEFQTAALAIYALKTYGPPAEKADTEKVIARAAAWLETAKPDNTQDRAFHVLALAWSNPSSPALAASVKALAATQRADGGWSQMTTMGSDAYATGQALYALNVSGKMPATHATYSKGVKYLLRTQAADGSWHVKTRSIWVQPYFDSGFPYAHDQWISVAGTSWAAMALAVTAEPQRISQALPAR